MIDKDIEISCYKQTEDDWAGSYGICDATDKPSSKGVHLSLYSAIDFDHIHYELFEEISRDYEGMYGDEAEPKLEEEQGIRYWFITASGTDDMALERKYRCKETALSEFLKLMALDSVNFDDINRLTGVNSNC